MTVKKYTINLNKTLGTVVGMDYSSSDNKSFKKNNNNRKGRSSSKQQKFPKLLAAN